MEILSTQTQVSIYILVFPLISFFMLNGEMVIYNGQTGGIMLFVVTTTIWLMYSPVLIRCSSEISNPTLYLSTHRRECDQKLHTLHPCSYDRLNKRETRQREGRGISVPREMLLCRYVQSSNSA